MRVFDPSLPWEDALYSIEHSLTLPLLAAIMLCALPVVIAAYANRGGP